jgi:quinolinate synthase
MVLWQGSCIVHETFNERKIIELKSQHPKAKLIAHPECEESLLTQADFIASTSGLLKYARESSYKEFIVATEVGIIHQMEKYCPDKLFIPAPPNDASCSCNECPYMKLNTMEKLYLCMKNRAPEIIIDEKLLQSALLPIQRML